MDDHLTRLERDLARYALGLSDYRKTSTRNYFIAYRESEYDKIWMGLVARGLAESQELYSGYRRFSLTRAGAELAIYPYETLRKADFRVRISEAKDRMANPPTDDEVSKFALAIITDTEITSLDHDVIRAALVDFLKGREEK
jgi:hypothetical protein